MHRSGSSYRNCLTRFLNFVTKVQVANPVKLLYLGCKNNFEAGAFPKIMPRYPSIDNLLSLQQALEGIIVDDLKKLKALLPDPRKLTRKADLVDGIRSQLLGENLRKVWLKLDDLQKAAVAEVIHGEDGYYFPDIFRAKYGEPANFGTIDRYGTNREPSLLCLFIYGSQIP